MKICDKCGAVNDDDREECLACGASIKSVAKSAAPAEMPAEKPDSPLPDGYCGYCGYANVPGSSVCDKCGNILDGEIHDSLKTEQQEIKSTPKTSKEPKPAEKNTTGKQVTGMRVFENVITCIIAFVCALVGFLTPIKVMAYTELPTAVGVENHAFVENDFIEITQTPAQIFSAFSYTNDEEKRDEIRAEYQEILIEARAEAKRLDVTHIDGVYDAIYMSVLADKLSEINYFAYLLCEYQNPDTDFSSDKLTSIYANASVGAVVGCAACVMSYVLAALSIVELIKALTRITSSGEPDVFGYLRRMLTISGVGLILCAVSPFLKASGALFAISMLCAISYGVLAAIRKAASGNAGGCIKCVVVTALTVIAFFLLCTNAVTLMTDSYNISVSVPNEEKVLTDVPFGFGWYGAIMGIINSPESMGFAISSLLLFGAAIAAMGISYYAMYTGLKSMIDKTELSKWLYLSAAIVNIFAIILINTATAALGTLLGDVGESCFILNPQMYFTAALMGVAFVISVVTDRHKKTEKHNRTSVAKQ